MAQQWVSKVTPDNSELTPLHIGCQSMSAWILVIRPPTRYCIPRILDEISWSNMSRPLPSARAQFHNGNNLVNFSGPVLAGPVMGPEKARRRTQGMRYNFHEETQSMGLEEARRRTQGMRCNFHEETQSMGLEEARRRTQGMRYNFHEETQSMGLEEARRRT